MNHIEAIKALLLDSVQDAHESKEFSAIVLALTPDQLLTAARLYSQLRVEDIKNGRAEPGFNAGYTFYLCRTARLAVMDAISR